MANSLVLPAKVYYQDQKVGECSNATYTVMNNGANQYGLEGVIGQSLGAEECKVEMDVIVPIQGLASQLKDAIRQPNVTVGVELDGALELVVGLFTERNYTSDSKTGELKGKFTFIGGAPNIIQ